MAKAAVAGAPPAPQEKVLPLMLAQFKAAKRVSTPIIAIQSLDPTATIAAIGELYWSQYAIARWDIVRGLVGLNQAGQQAIKALMPPPDPQTGPIDPKSFTTNPVDALSLTDRFPKGAITFILNAHN